MRSILRAISQSHEDEQPVFDAIMDHALKYGYDHQRGGLYEQGVLDQIVTTFAQAFRKMRQLRPALSLLRFLKRRNAIIGLVLFFERVASEFGGRW